MGIRKEKRSNEPLNVSYGRTGGKPDGEIVYIVTYWVGIDTDETMVSVMTPNSNYSCILFRTFDVKLNPLGLTSIRNPTYKG